MRTNGEREMTKPKNENINLNGIVKDALSYTFQDQRPSLDDREKFLSILEDKIIEKWFNEGDEDEKVNNKHPLC